MMVQKVSRRSIHRTRLVLVSIALTATTVILSPTLSGAAGNPVLAIVDYAFVTATHSKPSHAVTAADLLDAAETEPIAKSNLSLQVNIGDIFAYPRLALFSNSTTYAQTCVNFPSEVGRRPYEIKCPARVITLWTWQPTVLNGSREAVEFAETQGLAVSGPDVGQFFDGSNVHIVGNPDFKPGQGGVVRFAIKLKINKIVAFADICVRFPSTEAGIPVQVTC